jgi:uncharacterized membrane protein
MKTVIVSVCHFLHLLATVVWIGGIAMILLVILPGARNSLDAKNMGEVMKEVARRFTPLANASIVILVITGLLIGHVEKGFFGFGTWETPGKAVLVLILSCSLMTIYDMLFSGGEKHANTKAIAGRRL